MREEAQVLGSGREAQVNMRDGKVNDSVEKVRITGREAAQKGVQI